MIGLGVVQSLRDWVREGMCRDRAAKAGGYILCSRFAAYACCSSRAESESHEEDKDL